MLFLCIEFITRKFFDLSFLIMDHKTHFRMGPVPYSGRKKRCLAEPRKIYFLLKVFFLKVYIFFPPSCLSWPLILYVCACAKRPEEGTVHLPCSPPIPLRQDRSLLFPQLVLKVCNPWDPPFSTSFGVGIRGMHRAYYMNALIWAPVLTTSQIVLIIAAAHLF